MIGKERGENSYQTRASSVSTSAVVHQLCMLQDDSFWLWDATSLTLLKKLEAATPGSSQPACRVFCVSPDGAWMVAGGTAPLLFIWDLAAAELLYALHLPIPHSAYGTAQLHFMPDSQTVAGDDTPLHAMSVSISHGVCMPLICCTSCQNRRIWRLEVMLWSCCRYRKYTMSMAFVNCNASRQA